jgi:hypothetical protein
MWRLSIFATGVAMLALGGLGFVWLGHDPAFEILHGALLLGGGLIICGLFSLKMPWHGRIGAGALGLIGAARGLGNLPGLIDLAKGQSGQGITPLFELAFTVLSLALLVQVLRALQRERGRRLLESEQQEPPRA